MLTRLNDILTGVQNCVTGINSISGALPIFAKNVILAATTRSSQGTSVTQTGTFTSPVTINAMMGQITTVSTTFTAGTILQFTVNNSFVAFTDLVSLGTQSVGNNFCVPTAISSGSFGVVFDPLVNATTSVTINFAVIKSALL